MAGTASTTVGEDLLKLGFIGNGFIRKGGDLLLKVHQEQFADLAHLTLVTHDPPKGLTGLRNVDIRTEVPWFELMTSVLPGFDLFVFPTRFDYSPYAVIEAMSAGVPVISTRVGAIPEMIEDGVGGFLIEANREAPLADRVNWAIEHRAQLPAMGARARERATDRYAAERNYPQLLDTLAGWCGKIKLLVGSDCHPSPSFASPSPHPNPSPVEPGEGLLLASVGFREAPPF